MKTKKLSKRLKKEWVKALRSGEYKQCPNRLHDGDGFCCLGVLADINEDGYWVLPDHEPHDSRLWMFKTKDGKLFQKIYGDHFIMSTGILTRMNDTGKSFSEIADWIEGNL